jgi:soluble lytic murein transglycosylase-like protein
MDRKGLQQSPLEAALQEADSASYGLPDDLKKQFEQDRINAESRRKNVNQQFDARVLDLNSQREAASGGVGFDKKLQGSMGFIQNNPNEFAGYSPEQMHWIAAIGAQESAGNPNARSPVGAFGFMQVMPDTGAKPGYGIKPLRDGSVRENVRLGLGKFEAMMSRYNGDVDKALAAYNAGEGNVDKAVRRSREQGGDWKAYLPRPQETIPYINNVKGYYSSIGSGQSLASNAQPQATQSKQENTDGGRYRPLSATEMARMQAAQEQGLDEFIPFTGAKPIKIAQQPTQKNPKNKEEPSFLSDTGNLLLTGLSSSAEAAYEITNRIPGVKHLVGAMDKIDQYFTGKTSQQIIDEAKKKYEGNLSTKTTEARKKLWVVEPGDKLDDGTTATSWGLGEAWKDPRAYYAGIVESTPEMAMSMGGSLALAKGAFKKAITTGATREVAAKKAAATATIAGGLIEGGFGGAHAAIDVRKEINSMSEDMLKNSDAMKALIADGKSFEQARNLIAEDAATKAFVLAGIGTGIFGGMGDRAIAKVITEGTKSRFKSAASAAVAEGLLEEMPQSALQQVAQNYAVQEADPNRSLTKGVANQAAGGAVLGSIMGGGLGAAGHRTNIPPQIDESIQDDPQAGTDTPTQDIAPEQPIQPEQQPARRTGPIERAIGGDNLDAQIEAERNAVQASQDQWLGEPGTVTQISPKADPNAVYTVTVDGYENGDVFARDQDGTPMQFGQGDVNFAQPVTDTTTVEQVNDVQTTDGISTDDQTISNRAIQEDPRIAAVQGDSGTDVPSGNAEAASNVPDLTDFGYQPTQPAKAAEDPNLSTFDTTEGQSVDTPPITSVEIEPAEKTLGRMTDAELRARMKYLATLAKTNGGWDKILTAERRKVEAAINKLAKKQAAAEKTTELSSTAEQIKQGMSEISRSMDEGARDQVAEYVRDNKTDRLTYRKEDSIQAALSNPNYNVQKNDDGSVTVIGVKTADDVWHGVARNDAETKKEASKTPSFDELFLDAHINNPSQKTRLIQAEIKKSGRTRSQVFADVKRIVDAYETGKAKPVEQKVEQKTTDKPLAADGLKSYRYKGQYGWIMIGAKDVQDALNEASRSTNDQIEMSNLQEWDGSQYVNLKSPEPTPSNTVSVTTEVTNSDVAWDGLDPIYRIRILQTIGYSTAQGKAQASAKDMGTKSFNELPSTTQKQLNKYFTEQAEMQKEADAFGKDKDGYNGYVPSGYPDSKLYTGKDKWNISKESNTWSIGHSPDEYARGKTLESAYERYLSKYGKPKTHSLQEKRDNAIKRYNDAVDAHKKAKEQGLLEEEKRQKQIILSTDEEVKAITREYLGDIKKLQLEVQQKALENQAESYLNKPIGTRFRPSEFSEERGLFWEKTASNEWTGRGDWFQKGKTHTNIDMAKSSGMIEIKSNAAETKTPDTIQDIKGKDIGDGWSEFSDQSGTIGIPRAEMPQIKAEHRGAMVNFMNARGISHQEETVTADSLKPTQAEFSQEKVDKAKNYEGGNRSILISSDNHVLDGHHQWMAARETGEDVKVIRLNAPIRDLVVTAHEFPSSTVDTSQPKTTPVAKKSKDQISFERNIKDYDQSKGHISIEKLQADFPRIDQNIAEQDAIINDPKAHEKRAVNKAERMKESLLNEKADLKRYIEYRKNKEIEKKISDETKITWSTHDTRDKTWIASNGMIIVDESRMRNDKPYPIFTLYRDENNGNEYGYYDTLAEAQEAVKTLVVKDTMAKKEAAKTERPSMPKNYNVGPFTGKTTPIGKTVYREMDAEGLYDLTRNTLTNGGGNTSQLYVADNIDLAMGQGANKGILVQMRGDAVSGKENYKPGTGDITGREYVTDFIGMDAIDQILIQKGIKLRPLTRQLIQPRFDRKILDDGSILFTRKGVDVGTPLSEMRLIDTPTPKAKHTTKAKPAEESNTENKFQKYDDVAQQYGRSVNSDGAILSNKGKDTGVRIVEKKGRIRIERQDGQLLFSGTNPESLGKFLEDYWFDKKLRFSRADNQNSEINDVRKQYEGTDQWMKAPNGKLTNLNEQQWLQVRTPSFKNWFGDWENDASNASQVVDENGEPLVVYHGAKQAGFSEFDNDAEPRFSETPPGSSFFAANRDVAVSYAGSIDEAKASDEYDSDEASPGIYPVFLNIRDPQLANYRGNMWNGTIQGEKKAYQITVDGFDTFIGDNGQFIFDSEKDAKSFAEHHNLQDFEIDEALFGVSDTNLMAHRAKNDGKDGAILSNVIDYGSYIKLDGEYVEVDSLDAADLKRAEKVAKDIYKPSTIYVTFSPEQIKSATDNTGAFDPTNPDIRFSRADLTDPKDAETGKPINAYFSRNTVSSKNYPQGMDFGQDLEPAGEYMNIATDDMSAMNSPGWQYGVISFKNPLVLEHKSTDSSGWKKDLSEMFDGKTGKALSAAIKRAGYDAVVTKDKYGYSEIVNLNGEKAQFSKTDEQPKNLFVAHNLSASNILAANDLGGLAAPSIAVARSDVSDFSGFGEVTLLADPKLLEDSKIRTFDADIYSPRQPRASYELDKKKFNALLSELEQNANGLRLPSLDEASGTDGAENFVRSDAMQLAYLNEIGKAPKLKQAKVNPYIKNAAKLEGSRFSWPQDPKFAAIAKKYFESRIAEYEKPIDPALPDDAKEVMREINQKGVARAKARYYNEDGTLKPYALDDLAMKADNYRKSGGYDYAQLRSDLSEKMRNEKTRAAFEKWATDKFNSMVTGKTLFKGFTNAGNKKYLPYTLENVVSEMTQQLQAGEGTFYGAGSARSAYANEMKTLKDIQSRRDQIVTEAEMEKLKEESSKVFEDALERLKPFYKYDTNGWGYLNDAGSAIAEGQKGIREAFKVTPESRKIIADLTSYLANLPTAYFEAKAQRAVQFSEFNTAVVPKGMDKDALQVLRDAGLKIKTYDPKSEGDRARIIAQQEKLLFSQGDRKGTGITVADVRNRLIERFGKDVITRLEDQGILSIDDSFRIAGVEGYAQDGNVTLVANALTPDTIVPVFLHELGGHAGMQGVMKPTAYKNLMDQFDRLVAAKDPIALEAKRLAERETDAAARQDEYLPYLITVAARAQNKRPGVQTLVNRIVAAVKAWAVDKLGLNLNLNANDVLALAERMVNTLGNRDANGMRRFSKADTSNKPLTKKQFFKKYKSIHVDFRGGESNREPILTDGFREGVSVNALSISEYSDQPYSRRTGFDKRFAPKTDSYVWLLGKDGVVIGGNGDKTKEGYIPDADAGFKIVDQEKTVYENYLIAFNASHGSGSRFSREDQTNTPEFKKWFGDSKVVDEDGKPQIRYHGTRDNWSQWDKDKAGGLIHTTDDMDIADRYAQGAGGGRKRSDPVYQDNDGNIYEIDGNEYVNRQDGSRLSARDIQDMMDYGDINPIYPDARIKPIYVRSENPLDLNTDHGLKVLAGIQASSRFGQSVVNQAKDGYFDWNSTKHEFKNKHWANDLVPKLKELGYDAIIFSDDGHQTLSVFDSEQIKSATDNTGAFDPTNPDIRFSRADDDLGPVSEDEYAMKLKQWWDEAKKLPSDKLTKLMTNGALGLIPLRQMLNEMASDLPSAKVYLRVKDKMDTMRNKWHAKTDAVAQEWLKYRIKNKDENRELMDIMHESTLNQVDPSMPFQSLMTPQEKRSLANPNLNANLRAELTLKQELDDKREEAYDVLKERFDPLSAEAKEIYKKVRDTYTDLADAFDEILLANMEKAINVRIKKAEREHGREMERITDEGLQGQERDDAIAAADRALNNAKTKIAWNRKARMTRLRKQFETQRLQGPYFPLARFGSLFVTVRDAKTGEVVSFSRFEDPTEQRRFAEEMRKDANYKVEEGALIDGAAERKAVDPNFVADVEDILADLPNAEQVKDEVWQRYLESLPDMSVRKARIHRKGREGYNADAVRAFGSHMFHGSHQLARMAHSMDLEDALDQARDDARETKNPKRSSLIVNEMEKRHKFVMSPTGGALAQWASSFAFVWYLAGSPKAAIMNLFQTPIMGVPILGAYAGGLNGIARAGKELTNALVDFTKGKGFAERSSGLTAEERKAMADGYEAGVIERTQGHDLAGVGETGVEYSAARERAMKIISWGFHHAERLNREVTFLAAYRLARKKGLSHDAAVTKAGDLTWKTHFDYSNTSRPRLMHNDTMKILLVFRNFQINMLYRLFRDTHQALNGETKEVRKEAFSQLAGITGMMMLNAGITGTWLFGIAMVMAGMFMDDGEDPKEELKKAMIKSIGPKLAGLALHGVPGYVTGTSLSASVGMADLWFRSPDSEKEGEEALQFWQSQLLGAVPAIGAQFARGLSYIGKGEVYRGIETMMPKMLKDPMKAYRYETEGAKNMRGDTVTDVTTSDVIKQALGFTPAGIAEQYQTNNASFNMQQTIIKERKSIMDDYYKANQEGDEKKLDKLAEKIDKFNEKNPEQKITPRSISQSRKNRDKGADNAVGGMRYNNKLRDRLVEDQSPSIYN